MDDYSSSIIKEQDLEVIEREINLNYDGRQFFIRFPVDVKNFYDLKKGDIIKLKITVPLNDDRKNREVPMELSLLDG